MYRTLGGNISSHNKLSKEELALIIWKEMVSVAKADLHCTQTILILMTPDTLTAFFPYIVEMGTSHKIQLIR